MNTPINFELAKLCNNKRVDCKYSNFYTKQNSKMFGIDEHYRNYPIKNTFKELYTVGIHAVLNIENVYPAPTIGDVIMWLYEKHGIWISVEMDYTYSSERKYFFGKIKYFVDGFIQVSTTLSTNSHKESFEKAIEYTLNNLI